MMPWAKLDDRFWKNSKIRAIGNDALAVYVTAIAYCADVSSDGFVDETMALALCTMRRVADPEAVIGELVVGGLWESCDHGHRVHDYLKYNPSSEEVEEQRRQNAARQADWRREHRVTSGRYGKDSNAISNGVTAPVSDNRPVPGPVPVPGPDPVTKKTKADAAASGGVAKATSDGLHQARFAVLARNCGHDLSNLGEREGTAIGVAAASLRKFTPDQIEVMCDNYPTHYPGLAMTCGAIAKNASKLLKPGSYAHSPSRSPNGKPSSWPAMPPETRPSVQAMREELKRGITPG